VAWHVKECLTTDEVESALKNITRHGLASQATVTLTGGAFLVGLALELGASNTLIGLFAAIAPLTQLLQIPSISLIEKLRTRRAVCVYAATASRIPWLVIALLPMLFAPAIRTSVLGWALVLNGSFAAVSNAAWNPWMRDIVPPERLGSFFGRRMSLATALGLVLSLIAAGYLDLWGRWFPQQGVYAYSMIYLAGFLTGILAVHYLFRIPEPRMAPASGNGSLISLITQPFKDGNFRNLIVFLSSWNFAVNLAAPFFTVYMLKRLGMSMSLVIVFMVLTQLTNLLFLRVWGRVSDRYSHKSVLRVSGPLFIACILAWTFTTMPERYVLTIPLLVVIHVFMGVSIAGVTLSTSNISLKLAPRGEATSYLAASSLANSLAAGTAPILGGRCVDFFAGRELSWTLRWTSPESDISLRTLDFQHWDFFFFFAFLLGLFSIQRLGRVKELGEVEERVVVTELMAVMRRKMGNPSTAAGLRRMVNFPLPLLKNRRRRPQIEGECGPQEQGEPPCH
jgi:MFS family permease